LLKKLGSMKQRVNVEISEKVGPIRKNSPICSYESRYVSFRRIGSSGTKKKMAMTPHPLVIRAKK
jgi:hypothetical protein